MYVFGASGHGKVIASILLATYPLAFKGFLDDNPTSPVVMNVPVFLSSEVSEFNGLKIIIGIGNNRIRKVVSQRLNTSYLTVLHPSSVVCSSAVVGVGTVVMAQAVVNACSKIGSHCIINSGAIVEHDCVLEHYVHVSPNAALAGNVVVGEGTQIGIGAVVIQGITIGKWVTIGAGAVIINDVPDFAVVVGNPGKIIKYNSIL